MKSNIILPPKIDTYIPYLPIENVAHFNANDNSLPYYIPIVYRYIYTMCMLETTCCTHAPIPKTPSSSSSNLKAHRVRHNHLQNSAAVYLPTTIEWDGKTTQFFYRGVESIYEVVVSKLNYL